MDSSAPSLSDPGVLYQLKHIHDDKTRIILTTSIIFIVVPIIAVILRLTSRHTSKVAYAWDDWSILIATFLYVTQQSIEIYTSHKGLIGKHAVAVGVPDLVRYFKALFVYLIVYPLGFPLTKISACLFYLRIFPGQNFRRITKITIVVLFCWIFATVVTVIFQCKPVSFFWKQAVPGTEGKCIHLDAFYYASTGNNIISDIWVLSLPVPLVWKLQVSVTKRIAICGIFLLGGFVTLISVVRIFYISKTLTTDPSWTAVDEAIWTNLEGALGIVCACLPSYGPLYSTGRNSRIAKWVSQTYTVNSEKFLASWSRGTSHSAGSKGTTSTTLSGDSSYPHHGRISVQNQVELESRLVPRRFEEFQCECGRSIIVGNAVKSNPAPIGTKITIRKPGSEK